MLEMFLNASGYRTLTATSGRVGIAIAMAEPLDAVVVDYEMPGLNGVEVAQILKEKNPTLPVVMYSAHPAQEAPGALAVVDAYVLKEHPRALVKELARVLHQPMPPLVKRRYPRYPVHVPLSLRREGDNSFQGIAVDLAEGGLGGTLEQEISPGEVVSVNIGVPACDVNLELRARVRYRNAASHGLEFVEVTEPQQADLRRCLQILSAA
jgi:CheY-like chemotaxis protein